jgi:hypothetical protein
MPLGPWRWAIMLLGDPLCQGCWGKALPGGTARESMAAKPANGVPRWPLESTVRPGFGHCHWAIGLRGPAAALPQMRAGRRAHSTSTSNRRHAAVAPGAPRRTRRRPSQQCRGRGRLIGTETVIAHAQRCRYPLPRYPSPRDGCANDCSPWLICFICARWKLLVPVGSGRCRRGGGARARRPARANGWHPRARFVFARREGNLCVRVNADA